MSPSRTRNESLVARSTRPLVATEELAHTHIAGHASHSLKPSLFGFLCFETRCVTHSAASASPGWRSKNLNVPSTAGLPRDRTTALLQVAVQSPDRFQCPADEADRFSLPDIRDHDKEEAYKAGQGFIYYQHLRKAGGTGFCEMAGRRVGTVRGWFFACRLVPRPARLDLFSSGEVDQCACRPFALLPASL